MNEVRYVAIKCLKDGWRNEDLNVIFELWIFDYREKQLDISKEDAKLWFLLNNWSTLFASMMSSKGKAPDFPYKSIKELMPVVKSQEEKEKESKELDDFSIQADKIANIWSHENKK